VKTLYRATRVHTLGHPRPGEWILVDERHVQRVGTGDPPAADRVVDLPGATIVPGFIDAHVHLTWTGLSLGDRDVAAARSREELLRAASDRAAAATDEPLIRLGGFDETRWADPALPTMAELEAVTARPLLIERTDGHISLANEAALREARALDAEGCERDAAGELTGVARRDANRRLSMWASSATSDHRIEELQLAGAAEAAAHGVTTVHQMAMPLEDGLRDVEVFLRHRDQLPVDTVAVLATTDIAWIMDLGLGSIGGDLPADGSVGARTAALSMPYLDADHEGATTFADDDLAGFFHDAHNAGLQAGVHAIGDRAIAQVLSAWERVYTALDSRERRHFRARRHRIEHVEMISSADVERVAALGLAASVQPAFDAAWGHPGGLYDVALGWERASGMNPFRTMLDRGVVMGVGSDAPVTPLDPWIAIAAIQAHHDESQRLTRLEAVRAHVTGSARLSHHDDKKGNLEPGEHADFVAYDVDPLMVDDIGGLRPILTVSLGREVFAA